MKFEHEVVIPNTGFPFKIFRFEGKEKDYIREKHWHRSIEIFAVFQGKMNFFIQNKNYHLEDGELVLINSNEVHAIETLSANTTLVLQIPITLFKGYYQSGTSFVLFQHSQKKYDNKIMELVSTMYEEIQKKEIGYEWKVQSEFYSLLYLLIQKYRHQTISKDVIKSHKGLDKLSRITAYIREYYQKDLSLENVAEVFGYSPAYLSRMFQKYAGTNYKTYLQNIRLEYAYREFVNTDHTILDIAMKYGFPNSKAFTKAFQEKYKILPSEYRKRQKNDMK